MPTQNMERQYLKGNDVNLVPRQSLSKAFTGGALLAQLLVVFAANVERLESAVEASSYVVPAGTLSAAILTEHLNRC